MHPTLVSLNKQIDSNFDKFLDDSEVRINERFSRIINDVLLEQHKKIIKQTHSHMNRNLGESDEEEP